MKLLQIQSGIFAEHSQSNHLTSHFGNVWLDQHPQGEVITRDVVAEPVEHFSAKHGMAFNTPESDRTPEQQALVEYSNALIEEINQADAIVMGVPMYNFSIPSQLKSYFDQLARVGVTFQYTENGPKGLLENKPVYIVQARGGMHKDKPTDTQTSLLSTYLGFLGLHDVKFIFSEGLSMGDEAKEAALHQAKQEIETLLK